MWTDIHWWAILIILAFEVFITVLFIMDSREACDPHPLPYILLTWCVGVVMIALNVPFVQAWNF